MLTAGQRAEVEALRRDRLARPADRDRVEMVLLSAAGWMAPRIGAHMGCCTQTVRRVLHRFAAEGVAALRRRSPGPAPNDARRTAVEEALGALLTQERTWTAADLAAALGEQGIALSGRQVRRYLGRMGARYRRAVRTVAHKQDPARVAVARVTLADLKQRPPPGA